MDAVTKTAVTRAITTTAANAARAELAPGRYNVDTTVRVVGDLLIGEDETYTPTTSLPVIGITALMMRYCGITREAALAAIQRIATEAMQDFQKVGDACQREGEWMDEMTRAVRAMTRQLPAKERKGKVHTNLRTEVVV